jgi:hypothetical protein
MTKKKIDTKKMKEEWGLTEKEVQELSKGLILSNLEQILKNGDISKGIAMLVKNVSQFYAKSEDIEFTFQLFKWYYDQTGKPFNRKHAAEIRNNLLHLSSKLYEIHTTKIESISEEN